MIESLSTLYEGNFFLKRHSSPLYLSKRKTPNSVFGVPYFLICLISFLAFARQYSNHHLEVVGHPCIELDLVPVHDL